MIFPDFKMKFSPQFHVFEIKINLTVGVLSWFNWQQFFLSLWYVKLEIHPIGDGTSGMAILPRV